MLNYTFFFLFHFVSNSRFSCVFIILYNLASFCMNVYVRNIIEYKGDICWRCLNPDNQDYLFLSYHKLSEIQFIHLVIHCTSLLQKYISLLYIDGGSAEWCLTNLPTRLRSGERERHSMLFINLIESVTGLSWLAVVECVISPLGQKCFIKDKDVHQSWICWQWWFCLSGQDYWRSLPDYRSQNSKDEWSCFGRKKRRNWSTSSSSWAGDGE